MINPATTPHQARPINHMEALKALMDKRAFTPLTNEDRAQLDGVIETYKRLYLPGDRIRTASVSDWPGSQYIADMIGKNHEKG